MYNIYEELNKITEYIEEHILEKNNNYKTSTFSRSKWKYIKKYI